MTNTKQWAILFGAGHKPYGDCYTIVSSPTECGGEIVANELIGEGLYASIRPMPYPGIKRHNLRFVPLSQVVGSPPVLEAV